MDSNLGDKFLTEDIQIPLRHSLRQEVSHSHAARAGFITSPSCVAKSRNSLFAPPPKSSLTGSPYQDCVTVRTHSGAEPLVGLEIDLMFCVIQQDGAIPWRKHTEKWHWVIAGRQNMHSCSWILRILILLPFPGPWKHLDNWQKAAFKTPVTPFFPCKDKQVENLKMNVICHSPLVLLAWPGLDWTGLA